MGSSLNNHHHHYRDYYYDRPSEVHYHRTTYNSYGNDNNQNTPNTQNNVGAGPGPNQNMPNIQGRTDVRTNNNHPNERQIQQPTVYAIPEQNDNNATDSTEIVFENAYLIVGVESLLLYGKYLQPFSELPLTTF